MKKASIKKENMRFFFTLLVFGTFILSCSNDDNIGQNEFVGKTFDYLFFETEQECINAQPEPDFFLNCHQEISFIDNETAEIILSDIQYSTSYTIDNSKITIHSSENTFEFQNDIIFEKVSSSLIRRIENNTVWKQRQGNSIWN